MTDDLSEKQLKGLLAETNKAYKEFKSEIAEIRKKWKDIVASAVKKSDEKKVQKIKNKIDKIIIK